VRLVGAPPPGRRVNVRRTSDFSKPNIVDFLSKGDLFIAYQRNTTGSLPPGATSKTWYGNRAGTEWVHISGVDFQHGQRDVGADVDPNEGPPTDVVEDDDTVPGSDDLPDDIREGNLAAHEPPEPDVPTPDSDLDETVAGEPDEGEIPEA
jgi:hypothetical protein